MGADPRLALASVWRWTAIACAIWLGGLNLYAAQLRGEAYSLQTQMREQVQKAYPRLPVVLDAARQARQELDALLARQGSSSAGDFLPLARHGQPCPSPPTASRAPTPTTPSR